MKFHDLTVVEFRYTTLQLNRLNWSDYLDKPNPVASALMARMKIRKRDQWRLTAPRVALESPAPWSSSSVYGCWPLSAWTRRNPA